MFNKKGFSIIEVIVALFILGIVVLWSGECLVGNMRLQNNTRLVDDALMLSRSRMEDFRARISRGDIRAFLQPFVTDPDGHFDPGDTMDIVNHPIIFTRQYDMKTTIEWLDENVGAHNVFRVHVEVSHTGIARPLTVLETNMGESVEGRI